MQSTITVPKLVLRHDISFIRDENLRCNLQGKVQTCRQYLRKINEVESFANVIISLEIFHFQSCNKIPKFNV